jgi:predicted nuclease of restriction endonuclease-like RecB superfamily
MTTIEIQIEEKNKILKGLEKVYEKLLEFKKAKNSELVVLRKNKL